MMGILQEGFSPCKDTKKTSKLQSIFVLLFVCSPNSRQIGPKPMHEVVVMAVMEDPLPSASVASGNLLPFVGSKPHSVASLKSPVAPLVEFCIPRRG